MSSPLQSVTIQPRSSKPWDNNTALLPLLIAQIEPSDCCCRHGGNDYFKCRKIFDQTSFVFSHSLESGNPDSKCRPLWKCFLEPSGVVEDQKKE